MSYTNEQLELALTLLDTPKVKLLEIIVSQGAKLEVLEKDAKRYQFWRQRFFALGTEDCAKRAGIDLSAVFMDTPEKVDFVTDAAISGEAT